jgi:hypothetical protein
MVLSCGKRVVVLAVRESLSLDKGKERKKRRSGINQEII